MSGDIQRIEGFVRRLARRERALMLALVAFRALVLLFVGLLAAVLAPSLGTTRGAAGAGLVLFFGVASWGWLWVPLAQRWASAGRLERQAERVERLEPALRGRLVTAVAHLPRGGAGGVAASSAGEAMLAFTAARAWGTAQAVRPSRVHPLLPLGWSAGLSWLAALGMLVGVLLSPTGLLGSARWWMQGSVARVAAADGEGFGEAETAKVGDIVLRYVYPAYTGLEPLLIENSTGEVRALPGTLIELRLRTADVVEAGALAAYSDAPREVEVLDGGRRLSGSFLVRAEAGSWRMLTWVGGEERSSRAFAIEPEIDAAPEVVIDGKEARQVGVNKPVQIKWQAKDDFGIRSVTLVVNGNERRVPISEPKARLASLEGHVTFTPLELGLAPGDKARVAVAAWDNDAVSGSKRGISREIEITVLGAEGLREADNVRFQALRDELVDLLAELLVTPAPPANTSDGLARWGKDVGERTAFIAALQDPTDPSFLQDVVADLIVPIDRLVRYTQVAFTPGDLAEASGAGLERVAALRDEATTAVEDGILALDRVLRMRALNEVVNAAKQLGKQAERLEALLASDQPDAVVMIAELQAIERRLAKMMAAAQRLESGGLKETVNQRNDEMRSLIEEIRKAIEEGRLDEAKALMARLSKQMADFAKNMEDELNRAQQGADEAEEQADALKEALSELESAQRDLQARTEQMREASDSVQAEEIARLWAALEAEVVQLIGLAKAYQDGLVKAGRPFHEQKRAEEATSKADRLLLPVRGRDLRGAVGALGEVDSALALVEYTLREVGAARRVSGPGRAEVRAQLASAQRIRELLDRLQQASEAATPQAQRGAQGMEKEQRALQERLKEASKKAREVAREYPVEPKGLEEAINEAQREMERSAESLQGGRPLPAEGSEGAAADRLRDAQQAIERAQQEAARQRQAGEGEGEGSGRPGGEEGEGGEEEGEQEGEGEGDQRGQGEFNFTPFELSTDERRLDAEAYRRALMEGMDGEVPEAWSADKKRYFEELVRQ